jgi:Predicted membrane protein (DUF2232)
MPILALAAAGAGLFSAVFHATLLTGSLGAVIFAYLAQLPLFLVGLWLGAGAAALAAAVAVAVLVVISGFVFALAYVAANALPAVVITWLAQHNRRTADGHVEWLPAGLLVAWLVGLTAAAFLIICLALSGPAGGAEGLVRRFIEAGLQALTAQELDPEIVSATAAALARFFPGVAAASWMAMTIANGVLAQGLLARFGCNLRPSPKMAEIDLPSWLRPALAIAALGAFFPGTAGFLGGNLVVIFVVAFALAGLGVIHALVASLSSRGLLLGATYALLFLFGWPIVIAALLGLAEPWLNLRRRAAGRRGT